MGSDSLVRHVHMTHPNPHYWKLSLDVKSVSRGGVGRRTLKLPYRYKRHYGLARAINCVSAKIHNRRSGLSQVPLHDSYATPLPQEFLGTVAEALTSYHGTPSSSGRSSPTITETQSTASTAQGDWTTGNTTERSSTDSTYSWDEFDKQAAKTVQFFFDQIDSVLYEQKDGPQHIRKECQEWEAQFPHLRILGKQMLSLQESGYKSIPREGSRPSTGTVGLMDVTDLDISGAQDIQGLTLSGKGISIKRPPVEVGASRSGTDRVFNEYTHLEEEVFAQDGVYEEIIAIEFKDIYEDYTDKKQLTPRRRKFGYPPITPNLSIKDSVISSAFDSLWQEIISWMRELLKKYTSTVLYENKPLVVPIQDMSISLPHQLRNDPLPPSRETSFNLYNKIQRSHTTVGVSSYPPQHRLNDVLNDVLLISKKDIILRENSNLAMDSDPVINTARPASSANPSGMKSRPMSVKYQTRPIQRQIRLAPITLTDRSRTPNIEDDRPGFGPLLVKRLTPQNERLSSPITHHQRNGTLPPLSSELEVPLRSLPQKKVHSANRASSAVDKDPRGLHRTAAILPSEARPSTTHAMRSDTPLGASTSRRASTPFGANLAAIPQRSPVAPLGIMGSSLQTPADFGHPGILEADTEGSLDDHYHNQWTPSPPSQHNPYRRLKQSPLVKS